MTVWGGGGSRSIFAFSYTLHLVGPWGLVNRELGSEDALRVSWEKL
jgi:hypothetical protein